MNLEDRALEFAADAHAGQTRRYTGEDYIVHPIEVARIVQSVSGTQEMIAAALLHDTVEDTPAKISDIFGKFGPEVGRLVFWLTDPQEEGSRQKRKALIRYRWMFAPREAKLIKLADLNSNLASILCDDPKFAPVYAAETWALLDVLRDASQILLVRARNQIREFYGNSPSLVGKLAARA